MSRPASTLMPAESAAKGELFEYRGWRGRLETAPNPFGQSGRERKILRDRWGIEYLFDPVSDLVYCSPRFSQESLESCYQSPSATLNTDDFQNFNRAEWEKSGHRSLVVSRLKVNLVQRYLKPPARVLDVGCHMGLFVMLLQEAGFDGAGMDVAVPAIETGTKIIGVKNLQIATIEHANLPPESFDGLVIWDVLEHVANLMEVMDHCAAAIKPGGYFFAQVPNHRGITARLKTFAAKVGLTRGKYNHFGFPWHLFHFSPRSLDALVKRVGMETVEIASFNHRSKSGQVRGPMTRFMERMALSDYIYIVARKTKAKTRGSR